MQPTNAPLARTIIVLYGPYMFRPHLRHPQEAPLQDLKLTAIR